MAQKIGIVVADFETSLGAKLAVGAVSASIQNGTDDDSVALPAGKYYFTLDGNNSSKEHIFADLSGTTLTNIKSVSRQGAHTTGVAREHRLGAKVILTDFASLRVMSDILKGEEPLDATNPLEYDANPTFNADHQIVTKKYVADNYLGVAENDTVTGNYTFTGNNTFQNKIQANGGLESIVPIQAPDPVNSDDVATKAYVLTVAFGSSLVAGLNSPEVRLNARGLVQSIHDVDNGKTYVLIYDTQDRLQAIYDGTSTWFIQYRSDSSLLSITKH